MRVREKMAICFPSFEILASAKLNSIRRWTQIRVEQMSHQTHFHGWLTWPKSSGRSIFLKACWLTQFQNRIDLDLLKRTCYLRMEIIFICECGCTCGIAWQKNKWIQFCMKNKTLPKIKISLLIRYFADFLHHTICLSMCNKIW